MTTKVSPFSSIEAAPADPILGLTEAFNADPNGNKVNLGVGVYQNGNGKVPVLNVVREAEKRWYEEENSKSYLPIDGIPAFNREVQRLMLGSNAPHTVEKRAVTVQAPGGTGALRIGADFLQRFFPGSDLWISDPSWENHRGVFEAAGFKVNTYPYYDRESHGLDFEGMLTRLRDLPSASIVVLHACCHNPSGVDPTPDQWNQIAQLFAERDLMPFLDFAYQGFGQGIEEDAYAVRAFAAANIPCLIANSFSKSFSLYRERVGGLTFITESSEEAARVLSQVKRIIRTNYSSPPSHGAQVVAMVLADRELRLQWEAEVAEMRDRIHAMRRLFVEGLHVAGVEGDYTFIERQQGMFSFSGLPLEAVKTLRQQYGIYIVDSGRVCVAAMNRNNINAICAAIAKTLKDS